MTGGSLLFLDFWLTACEQEDAHSHYSCGCSSADDVDFVLVEPRFMYVNAYFFAALGLGSLAVIYRLNTKAPRRCENPDQAPKGL